MALGGRWVKTRSIVQNVVKQYNNQGLHGTRYGYRNISHQWVWNTISDMKVVCTLKRIMSQGWTSTDENLVRKQERSRNPLVSARDLYVTVSYSVIELILHQLTKLLNKWMGCASKSQALLVSTPRHITMVTIHGFIFIQMSMKSRLDCEAFAAMKMAARATASRARDSKHQSNHHWTKPTACSEILMWRYKWIINW